VAAEADPAITALLHDLKASGLLKETLILIGGEFGRTPVVESGGAVKVQYGRDHNNHGFSMVLSGGGVKGGMIYGATDEFGFKAVEQPVHVHDLHATVLHLLGLDHTKLTYRYSGRDYRLTDVEGNVIKEIIA
jgi:arylsulfatase A-like enzyme